MAVHFNRHKLPMRKSKGTIVKEPIITRDGLITNEPSLIPASKEYVLGFLFNNSHRKVCLIRKKRPDWQKDKLNGIGGKLEPWELPSEAMSREFKEETSVSIPIEEWTPVIELLFTGIVVYVYTCANQTYFDAAKTTTDEEIEKTTLHYIHSRTDDCINNIQPICRLCEQAIHFADIHPYNLG